MKMTITYANFISITTEETNQGRQRIINWMAVRFLHSVYECLMKLKSPKIGKISPAQIIDSRITCKQMHISRISKIENRIPLNHGIIKSLFTRYAQLKCLFTRPEMQG